MDAGVQEVESLLEAHTPGEWRSHLSQLTTRPVAFTKERNVTGFAQLCRGLSASKFCDSISMFLH